MIIFNSAGFLGNQIFQYMFLKTIQKENEKLFLIGFDDLFDLFDIEDSSVVFRIEKKSVIKRNLIDRFFFNPLRKLSDLNLFSKIAPKYEIFDGYKLETGFYKEYGFFKCLFVSHQLYMQGEKFFDKKYLNLLKIKSKYLKKAEKFLEKYKKCYKVVVHIRYYRDFEVLGDFITMPIEWYKELITYFEKNYKDVVFVFLTNDKKRVDSEFRDIKNKIISDNDFKTDFALMTLCNSAIISPSTFGWWGTYLMKNRDEVFIPKYWLGFNKKTYYPKFIKADFMKEIEVKG